MLNCSRLKSDALTLPSNSALFLEWNGVFPLINSNKITPIDHISALYEYVCFYTTWGAIYNGVPQIVFIIYPLLLSFFEKPKSAILISNLVVFKFTFFINYYLSSLFISINF